MLKKIIETSGFNAVVKGRYGYIVYNKNDIYVGKSIEAYGEFSEFEVEIFNQVCTAGDIVVEVGANIGTHTLVLSKLVGPQGRVYAFEPQRIVFQNLCANMSINSISNVECHQMAVSGKEGFILLPDIRYDVEGNFGGVEIDKFQTGQKVPAVTLDDFLEIPCLKLLKIDVEGMEVDVIQGAKTIIETHKPIIYIENDRSEKSKDLIEIIRSLNYRMFWHLPPLFNPNNFAGNKTDIHPGIVSVNMLCLHHSIHPDLNGFSEVIDSGFHPMKKTDI
ncbi:MAG: FkbM family methyltransferase [Proteobacteria bacterium]|nr:FkbM family methyltransferase [Pseudomonadota bacterium]